MPISQELRDRVFAWVSDDPDHATAQEALDLVAKGDAAELSDRFDSQLAFGTAGLRGLVGAGPNRMNRAVVRRTTAGLCAYLSKEIPDARERGLVIGRDGRRGSQEFAREAAEVAMGLGFVVHDFEELCPTPLCAFAVADLGAAAGVMVTASHNPPEYNGYKVYWANAAQIVPPHDAGIAQAIADIPGLKTLPMRDKASGRQLGLYRPVPREVEDRYFASISALDFGLPQDRTLRIAYTPLHGVGGRFVERAMREAGFKNFSMVALQARPDGAFPTVRFPNPEEPGAMDLVLELARQERAELVLANDPDADRLAVAYRRADGQYAMLTGNEIGVLLGHHRLTDDPRPPHKPLLITTIVSSPMLGAIAAETGARYEETLTGFKWIANKALEVEARGEATFIFGYEEALGSSVGPVVRDKDGVGSALVTARLAAQLKAQGRTIGDRLDEIASRFGVYVSGQINQTFPGSAGAARISALMNGLRESPPWVIGDTRVRELRDYKRGESRTASGALSKIDSPPSNVLTFLLESGDRIIARPSGTEPKIKFYFDVRTMRQGDEPIETTRSRGEARMEELKKHFRGIVGL